MKLTKPPKASILHRNLQATGLSLKWTGGPPQRRACQLVVECQMVSPGNIHTSNWNLHVKEWSWKSNYIEWGNPRTEKQTPHVLSPMWIPALKSLFVYSTWSSCSSQESRKEAIRKWCPKKRQQWKEAKMKEERRRIQGVERFSRGEGEDIADNWTGEANQLKQRGSEKAI